MPDPQMFSWRQKEVEEQGYSSAAGQFGVKFQKDPSFLSFSLARTPRLFTKMKKGKDMFRASPLFNSCHSASKNDDRNGKRITADPLTEWKFSCRWNWMQSRRQGQQKKPTVVSTKRRISSTLSERSTMSISGSSGALRIVPFHKCPSLFVLDGPSTLYVMSIFKDQSIARY